jgi:hypothetical protein
MTQRLPAQVGWIDEDQMIVEISRSTGTALMPELDPYLVAAKSSGEIRARPGKRGHEYSLPDLRKWLENLSPTVISGAKRGRKASYDWDAAWAFMCGVVHNYGLPKRQSEMVQKVQGWFSNKYDKEPSRSEIEKRVSLLYKAVKP